MFRIACALGGSNKFLTRSSFQVRESWLIRSATNVGDSGLCPSFLGLGRKLWGFGIHGSSQMLIDLPFLTEKQRPLLRRFLVCMIPFQHQEASLGILPCIKFEWRRYLARRALTHNLSVLFWMVHPNLETKARFRSYIRLIPSPPNAFGEQIYSHDFGVKFLLFPSLKPHQKSLILASSEAQRVLGRRKEDIQYEGIAVATALIRAVRPA